MLASVFTDAGISHIVISPGSRNAPLTVTFAALPQFECFTIVDERSAGFFALGMAQKLGKPVALMCTSGSAMLNYAPAVSEAYYQGVPLMVVSADRPMEWIDQADGQTIRQNGALDNFVRYSCQLPAELYVADDEWYANRTLNEAVYHLTGKTPGPVHLNIPFREPLYGKSDVKPAPQRLIRPLTAETKLGSEAVELLAGEINSHSKVMILLGQYPDSNNKEFLEELEQLLWRKRVVLLNESLSNLRSNYVINCIDSVVSTITDDEADDFRPELLITFDGAVVTKMVKNFLRKSPGLKHWHIGFGDGYVDTYQHLTRVIPVAPHTFLSQIVSSVQITEEDYSGRWAERYKRSEKMHAGFMQNLAWSDMKAFEIIGRHLPKDRILHLSNSSPVRYAQLFDPFYRIETYCNRGTSGIDGCTSTAVGMATVTDTPVLLITGDLSFLYDSNGLWNKYIKPSFRIIVINNGGGGIFRFISGEGAASEMDDYFVAKHQNRMFHIAMMYGFDYLEASDAESLKNNLGSFFESSQKPVILEISTSSEVSGDVLKSYFKNLKI